MMFKILIVDYNATRAESLKKRVEKYVCVQHKFQARDVTPEDTNSAKWELLMLHLSGQNPGGPAFAHKEFLAKEKMVVFYGGEGVENRTDYSEFIEGGMAYFHPYAIATGGEKDFYIEEWLDESNFLNRFTSFDVLKHGSHGARIVEFQRLRYVILSPLVALDLINQAEANNETIKIDNDIKKRVKEAISDLTTSDKRKKENSIDALCNKHIKCDEFREMLKALVNETDLSWKQYHGKLEDVVRKMEEQIAIL